MAEITHHIDFDNCTMESSKSVFDEVKRAIQANGSLDTKERDRLLLMAITCVFLEVEKTKASTRALHDTYLRGVIVVIIGLVVAFVFRLVTGIP